MNWVEAAARELFSLFVDDVRYTLAIILWIVFVTLALPLFLFEPEWSGPLLFLGCAAILVVSTWRAARA